MRNPSLLLLIPALCLAQASAQTPAPAAPQPHMTFDAMHHDFGKVPADTKVTHRFKVTNTGKAFLNITRLNPSCGCTSTVLGKWSLAPGEQTEIEVTFNSAGFRGISRKSLQVVSDDPANPTQTLTFEADVVREIMASTQSIFFQDLVRTSPRKASVKLESGNGQPVRITEVKAAGAPWLAFATRQEGTSAWVDITLDGRKLPTDRVAGADAIAVHTSNSKAAMVPLTVQWEVRLAIQAEPARVAWVEAAGKELRSTVTLKQVDNKPFRILSARTTNPVLKVEGLGKPAATHQELQMVLSAGAKAGMYTEKVLLTTDDPDQPQLEIRVSASLR